MPKQIVYTYTDEAPALATFSLVPILRRFAGAAGFEILEKDVSLSARILACFPEFLSEDQRREDALAELGELVKQADANIIKLPNISASLPQLTDAIAELQAGGYPVPDYPADPRNESEFAIRGRYARTLGSAVNPVIREGNSDRRVASPVKAFARKHPHSMGAWSANSRTHVASMSQGDFYGSERSITTVSAGELRVEFVDRGGKRQTLKGGIVVQPGEILDASTMSAKALREYYAQQFADARESGMLLSLHLKATMMKISDPILFGQAVRVYLSSVFDQHGEVLKLAGIDPNNGLGQLFSQLERLPAEQAQAIRRAIDQAMADGPSLAMVNSDKGITNLHAPNDIIVDASMAAAIRDGGRMWGPDGQLQDTKMLIPDRCYASVYQAVIEFCKENGAFDPASMGSVANVGLMAQQAEEYGSHDKTFLIAEAGSVEVIDDAGNVLLQHEVEGGDIWRMCQTKDAPVRDWVRLAVLRARVTGAPAIFWLDSARSHDVQLIAKVVGYLGDHDTSGLEIQIMPPAEAARFTCQRCRQSLDTISVTGNVLRDYLTDLFPILELGTSAKMLSIVPLLAGGSLYETGAGGSAPKHVQQFLAEGHLRWDSIGEFMACAASLEDCGQKSADLETQVLAETLNRAISRVLQEGKSPQRKVHQLDTRGSHFYLALFWAQALADQSRSPVLRQRFTQLARQLAEHESLILQELSAAQGRPTDIGGYYFPCPRKASQAMRPSATFNQLLGQLG